MSITCLAKAVTFNLFLWASTELKTNLCSPPQPTPEKGAGLAAWRGSCVFKKKLGEGGSGASQSEELAREGTVAPQSAPRVAVKPEPAGTRTALESIIKARLSPILTVLGPSPSGGSASTRGSHQSMHTPPLPVPTHPHPHPPHPLLRQQAALPSPISLHCGNTDGTSIHFSGVRG